MFKVFEAKFSKRKFIESKNKKTPVPFSSNSLGALCLRCCLKAFSTVYGVFFRSIIFIFCRKSVVFFYIIKQKMAAEEGFEPSQTESESAVLPLHHSAVYKNIYKKQQNTL